MSEKKLKKIDGQVFEVILSGEFGGTGYMPLEPDKPKQAPKKQPGKHKKQKLRTMRKIQTDAGSIRATGSRRGYTKRTPHLRHLRHLRIR